MLYFILVWVVLLVVWVIIFHDVKVRIRIDFEKEGAGEE